MTSDNHILILGGGAAGFFAAVTCAEANPQARVTILEKSRALLSKVRISGGGRCNVTHACFDPALLVQHYPRGSAALRGPFSRFQPRDTIAWFEQRGVRLKTESDGRVFPATDRSETIVECLLNAAQRAGVTIRTQVSIAAIERSDQAGFVVRSIACRPPHLSRKSSRRRKRCRKTACPALEKSRATRLPEWRVGVVQASVSFCFFFT